MSDDSSPPSASTSATAADGRLALSAIAQGAALHVTFRNVGGSALVVPVGVDAESGRQFDWFVLALTDSTGTARELRFVADRNSSADFAPTLQSGQSETVTINLEEWCRATAKGQRRLAPGRYRGTLVYDVPARPGWWSGRLELRGIAIDMP